MKHIVVCSDGTWNEPGAKDGKVEVKTNVAKMFDCICPTGKAGEAPDEIKQVKIYDPGVGTGGFLDKIMGGLTGAGIDKNIRELYEFVCTNYEPGDRIFLFGFSRGAYTVRSLAGFIRNCGLLKKQELKNIGKAYALYRDRTKETKPSSEIMHQWRSQHCIEDFTPVHFIGVWDTVGSLGIPLNILASFNLRKHKFHDHTLGSHVRHAYHALAIDERRSLFAPTLWEKSENSANTEQHLEQRWFAGVHSNVGGGYADCGLSDLPLSWLIEKATDAGLCYFDPPVVSMNGNCLGELRESFKPWYKPWGQIWRKVEPDNAVYNQTIDPSVWQRYESTNNYRPDNLNGLKPW